MPTPRLVLDGEPCHSGRTLRRTDSPYRPGIPLPSQVAAPYPARELVAAVGFAAQHVEVLALERLGFAPGLRDAPPPERAPVEHEASRDLGSSSLIASGSVRWADSFCERSCHPRIAARPVTGAASGGSNTASSAKKDA